jgi:hypothetical protein
LIGLDAEHNDPRHLTSLLSRSSVGICYQRRAAKSRDERAPFQEKRHWATLKPDGRS